MTATATIDTTLSDESTALKLIANLGFIETSVAALLVWQYLLTLDKEVALFWSRAPFGARVLFCSNRYLTLAWSLWAAAHWWAPWGASDTGCFAAQVLTSLLNYSQYLVWGAFSCLRVYALCQHSLLATLVLLLSLSHVIIGLAELRFLNISPDQPWGCLPLENTPLGPGRILTVVDRTCLMLADIIVAAVTWAITRADYILGRDVLRSTGKTTTFMGVLYKNGIVYFAALSIINVFHAAIYALEWTPQPAFSIYASRLTLSLAADASYTTSTAFLVSHFLVRLQEAARCLEEHASTPSIRGSRRSSVLEFVRADVDCATAESELDGYVHSSYGSSTDSARRHDSPEANRDPDGVEAVCMTVGCG